MVTVAELHSMGCNNFAQLLHRTFLKLFQHYIKLSVLEDEVDWMIVELANGMKWRPVIWVDKRQIFDVE